MPLAADTGEHEKAACIYFAFSQKRIRVIKFLVQRHGGVFKGKAMDAHCQQRIIEPKQSACNLLISTTKTKYRAGTPSKEPSTCAFPSGLLTIQSTQNYSGGVKVRKKLGKHRINSPPPPNDFRLVTLSQIQIHTHECCENKTSQDRTMCAILTSLQKGQDKDINR